jgi:hypothetical protein
MRQYRIFTVDFSGHRIGAKDVECVDDQEPSKKRRSEEILQ